MNSFLEYLIAQERMADLKRSAEQRRLVHNARTAEPNYVQLALSARVVARLRKRLATSATAVPVEDHRADFAISPDARLRSSLDQC
jgi:hypothetical protein